MVKLIVGGTGTGKTKTIIELVNAAVKDEKGSVVCIAKGDKLKFDISYDARLIDISDYMVDGYKGLLGFVAGLYKLLDCRDTAVAETFLKELDAFSSKHSVDFTVALSEEETAITESMKKYL